MERTKTIYLDAAARGGRVVRRQRDDDVKDPGGYGALMMQGSFFYGMVAGIMLGAAFATIPLLVLLKVVIGSVVALCIVATGLGWLVVPNR